MNDAEFDQWLKYHCDAFPMLTEWLGGLPNPQGTKRHWYRCLQDVRLEYAKKATDSMLASGTKVYKSTGYQEHPAEVARIARELAFSDRLPKSSTDFGPERYRCKHCLDTGYTTVWHPKTMAAVLRQEPKPKKYVCSVACDCEAGATAKHNNDSLEGKLQRPEIPRFDETVMVRCAGRSDKESFAYLVRNIDQIHDNTTAAMDNYDPALADF